MNILTLSSCLQINADQPEVVSFYGAGGKTTLLHRLAAELAGPGRKVILTTTAKIYRPANIPVVLAEDPEEAVATLRRHLAEHDLLVLGSRPLPGGKIQGITAAMVERIFRDTRSFVLVEADGAAGKPVKGYAAHEPALPAVSGLIVPVAGLDAVGAIVSEAEVHRPELLARVTGAKPGRPLAAEHLVGLIKYSISRGRERAPRARVVPVLNKVDLLERPRPLVTDIAAGLAGRPGAQRIVFTAAGDQPPVRFIFDLAAGRARSLVSCVVLAAGTASRMGRDKLALPLKGKTVLEHTLEQISGTGAAEIIVVTRPGSAWPEQLSRRTDCRVVVNPRFREGIASSLKAGIAAVDGGTQGVMFALGDQPLVPAEVYRALVEQYRRELKPATCPFHNGRRGNPVIFDRRAWPLLLALEGDSGGRGILALLPESEISRIEVRYPEIFLDLDTPAEYEALLERFKA